MIRGSTYQRKDGRWECRLSFVDENGKRRYRSFYGKTKKEAEYKLEVASRSMVEKKEEITEMTVKDLATEWLYAVKNRVKESTLCNYRMKIEKHIVPAFGAVQCAVMKARMVYEFIEKKLGEGLSARYITDIMTLFKSIFRYGAREYDFKNAVDGIIMPKKTKPEIKMLDKKQIDTLSAYINNNQNGTTLGIALSLYTGMRIGEVCALRWQDIDIEKRILTVSHTIQRIQCFEGERRTKVVITEPKSESSRRVIPIPDCLLLMLEQLSDKPDRFVLSGSLKPVEPRTMQNRFKRVLNNVNLPSTFRYHSLRHSMASTAIELGFDVKTLSEILGHSSVQITLDRYIHSSMEHKRSCMNLLTMAS